MKHPPLVLFLSLMLAPLCMAQTPINEIFEPAPPADAAAYKMVAVVQWNASQPTPVGPGVTAADAEAFKQANRESLAQYIRTAAAHGAKLVITPEFAVVNYPTHPGMPPEQDDFLNPGEVAPYVEAVPGPTSDYFGKLAKELGIYLHVGYAEVEAVTGKYYNVVVVLGPDGKIVTKYHKIHLFGLENDFLSPGDKIGIYDNAVFGKIGLAICADIFSHNPMSYYAGQVDVIALSTSWAQMDTGMGSFRRAAMIGGFPVLAANTTWFPDSGVINADGTYQSWIRQSSGIAYGYLPIKKLGQAQGQK